MSFTDGFVIIGHRGAAGLAPENTLKSFRLAEQLGVQAVELDVRLVEGRLAVFHDSTLERTTNGTGTVRECCWTGLRSLDAGDGERVPELCEVFDALDSKTGVNVELKGEGTGEALARLLSAHGVRQPVLVSSFRASELADYREAGGEAQIGLLLAERDGDALQVVNRLGAWSVHLHDAIASPDYMAGFLDLGLKVLVYIINCNERCKALRALGVQGVFTDFPDRVTLAKILEGQSASSGKVSASLP